MVRELVNQKTDFLILTETRTTAKALHKVKLKWGLKPTLYSLDDAPRGGVVIYSSPRHKLIPESRRLGTIPGHLAAAVYEVHQSRTVIVGIYGPSENDDKKSASFLKEVQDTISELKTIYNTSHVIAAGDFNAVWRKEDANNFQATKPRATAAFQSLMARHHLSDLAFENNVTGPTWFRHGGSGQSSRIDYILTNIPHTGAQTHNLRTKNRLTTLDHSYVEATFGQELVKRQQTMKDFILGSDEYLITAMEYLETCQADHKQEAGDPEQGEGDEKKTYTNVVTGKTALHVLNEAIQHLHQLHNRMAKEAASRQHQRLVATSKQLHRLKHQLKMTREQEAKDRLAEDITAIQRELSADIEAKDKAAQMRISHFYATGAGTMTPQSFYCIKEPHKSRQINKLIMEGREITDQQEIINIMQAWYERTAMVKQPQTVTLQQFLDNYDVQLPQLTDEQKDDLSDPFTQQEVHEALLEASEVSAPGPTGQTITFFKLIFSHIPDLLVEALNQLVFQPELASHPTFEWIKQRKVVYIPKKADPTHPGDYRPLSLLEVLYKIPSRIMSKRITKVLPTIIGQHQHGFMKQKGIQEPSLIMTHLIQDATTHNKPLQLISFDIEKAFDRISHEVIIQALRAFGFPEEYVQGVQYYTLMGFAYVEVNGRKGVLITIKTGSGQGDPMSSSLFDVGSEPLCLVLTIIMQAILYQDAGGLKAGPTIFADDNINPVDLPTSADLQPVLTVYKDYQKVSGLGINTNKSTALCINTPDCIQEGLQLLGINTAPQCKHLGIHLGETIQTTILETMRQVDTKLIRRRILATTPPTDMLHRAQLVNMAFTPILNHILMVLPVQKSTLLELDKEIRDFLWTKQCQGETVQKRRRVAKNRLAADYHLGGLNVPSFQTLAEGFRLNLLQRIYKRELQPAKYPSSHLPGILDQLLRRGGRPTLETHVQRLGPLEWEKTAIALKQHNKMFSAAFSAGQEILIRMEGDSKYWHHAPIKGHSLEGPFRITTLEGQQLHSKDINVIGQLYKTDQDSQQMRGEFDREGMQLAELTDNLIQKLSNMHESIRRRGHSLHDKSASPSTLLHFLLTRDGNISSNHKKRIKNDIAKEIGTAPAYRTRERDGVYVPDKNTFTDGYKICKLAGLLSKTREVAFDILNRTVWTNNKAYKSGTRDNPDCQLCGDIETMEHLIYLCPHYAEPLWQELADSLTTLLEHISGSPVARVHITPKEIVYNKPHPSVIMYLHDEAARCTILQLMQEVKRDVLYRRMNIRPTQQGAAVPKTRIQAHLIGTVNKLSRLLEYQNLRSGNEAKRILDKLNEIISARVE